MSQEVPQPPPLTRGELSELIEEYWRTRNRITRETRIPTMRTRMTHRFIREKIIPPEHIQGPRRQLVETYRDHIIHVADVSYEYLGSVNNITLIKLDQSFNPPHTYGTVEDIAPNCELEILEDKVYFRLGPLHSCRIKYIKNQEAQYLELRRGDLCLLAVHAYFAYTLGLLTKFHTALSNFIQRLLPYDPGSVELAGYEQTLERCMKIISIQDPRVMKRHILLAGPPGCGKSMIMKQLAINHPEYIRCSLTNTRGWLKWLKLLSQVNKHSEKRILVLIDEIDEMGLTREKDGDQVYELLRVMDGLNDSCGLVIVATTNRLQDLDEALLRPGRFGPVLYVQRPDETQRQRILSYYGDRYGATLDPVQVFKDIPTDVTGADIRVAVEMCLVQGKQVSDHYVSRHLGELVNARMTRRCTKEQ